jgi:hypothetical protein
VCLIRAIHHEDMLGEEVRLKKIDFDTTWK